MNTFIIYLLHVNVAAKYANIPGFNALISGDGRACLALLSVSKEFASILMLLPIAVLKNIGGIACPVRPPPLLLINDANVCSGRPDTGVTVETGEVETGDEGREDLS